MSFLFRAIDRQLERKTIAAPDRGLSLEQRWRLLRQFGSFPLAYASVTEKYLSSFGTEEGFIAYAQKMGETFALGDPVAAEESQTEILSEFVSTFKRPVFVACQAATAKELSAMGYAVNAFGHDTVIDLDGHSFAGGTYKRIRYATNWLHSHGMTMTEARDSDVPIKRINRLSRDWRKTRVTQREIRFLNREFSPKLQPDVRRFVARSETGTAIGFVNFDPIYADGHITGYLASQKRRLAEGSAYLDLAMLRHAIDVFQDEGLRSVHLGISPIADIGPSGFPREIGWLRRASRRLYNSDWANRRVFNSKGLAEHKNRFRGRKVPLYLCLPERGSNLVQVIGLLRLLRVV